MGQYEESEVLTWLILAGQWCFGEQPSAAKWNILGTNDASFNDGTGIANATITVDKLLSTAATAIVATSQTTTSTTYVDLGTVGPEVTVTIGTNGKLLVGVGFFGGNSGGNNYNNMGFELSGANTRAATVSPAYSFQSYASGARHGGGRSYLITGLSAGSTTVTAKYLVSAGTGTFVDREIFAIPL